jgi:hypothetical protein
MTRHYCAAGCIHWILMAFVCNVLTLANEQLHVLACCLHNPCLLVTTRDPIYGFLLHWVVWAVTELCRHAVW